MHKVTEAAFLPLQHIAANLRLEDLEEFSAARGEGLDQLELAVRDALSDRALEAEVETGVENGRVLAYLAQHAQIHDRTYDDGRVRLNCRLPRRCLEFLFEHGVHVRSNGQRLHAS